MNDSQLENLLYFYNENVRKSCNVSNAAFVCAKIGKLMFFFVITIPIGLILVLTFLILKAISGSYDSKNKSMCKEILRELIIKRKMTDICEIGELFAGLDFMNILEKMLKNDPLFKGMTLDSTRTKIVMK